MLVHCSGQQAHCLPHLLLARPRHCTCPPGVTTRPCLSLHGLPFLACYCCVLHRYCCMGRSSAPHGKPSGGWSFWPSNRLILPLSPTLLFTCSLILPRQPMLSSSALSLGQRPWHRESSVNKQGTNAHYNTKAVKCMNIMQVKLTFIFLALETSLPLVVRVRGLAERDIPKSME